MKEVKSPKKPLIYYYGIVLVIVVCLTWSSHRCYRNMVREVDYGTFMTMIEEKSIEAVQVEDSQIIFTDKDR